MSTATPAAVPSRVRVHVGDLISAGSAIGLLIVFLAMAWYGIAGVPNPTAAEPALSGVQTGWQALSLIRWEVVATVAAALGSVVLHATQRNHGARTDTSRLLLGLGLLTTLLLMWRVLIDFPSPDEVISQKLGALLGLFFAAGIAYGGHESLMELRDRRRLARPRHRTQTHATVPRPAADPAPTEATEADRGIALSAIDEDDFTWEQP
jgi:hypothetical protein